MSQILKLQEVGSKLRELVESFREQKETCIVHDDQNQPVAVVLPIDHYESYQAYQRQRDKDFAVLDEVADDLKDYDPDFIEAQIEKAVSEVKAESHKNSG